MSTVDLVILTLSGFVATILLLFALAVRALFRWWFAADRREARS